MYVGFNRFNYRRGADGKYRLQDVRYESTELTEVLPPTAADSAGSAVTEGAGDPESSGPSTPGTTDDLPPLTSEWSVLELEPPLQPTFAALHSLDPLDCLQSCTSPSANNVLYLTDSADGALDLLDVHLAQFSPLEDTPESTCLRI